jgi:hypothetical protein
MATGWWGKHHCDKNQPGWRRNHCVQNQSVWNRRVSFRNSGGFVGYIVDVFNYRLSHERFYPSDINLGSSFTEI